MSTGGESSAIEDESSTSARTFCRDVPSFLEPRDPSITNPWMRPRPTHGTNLCNLFEEDSYNASQMSEHLKVYLRVKPVETDFSNMYLLESETNLKSVHTTSQNGTKNMSKDCVLYKFTHIFNKNNQVTVFNKMIKNNLKEYIFSGQDFTLMTYGASGSGKTYSLMGIGAQPGIIPRCLEFLFQQVSSDSQPKFKPDDRDKLDILDAQQREAEVKVIRGIVKKCDSAVSEGVNLKQYRRMSTALSRASMEWKKATEERLVNTHCEVWVSFAEIYNEIIYDLLDETNGKDPPNRLKLIQPPDHKPYVKGLKWICVRSGLEAFSVLTRGRGRLRYANTCVNATSSRSHCIFTMKLIMYNNDTNDSKISTFRLCDLAGLERAKMTENRGERLNESKRINSSLHVLEKCLQALKSKQRGQQALPPYRESKLTALLQNALSGKENITLLVTINPEKKFFDETQHVLKFSALAQELVVDVQSKTEIQMSRHYSDIQANNNLSLTQQDILRLYEDIKHKEEEVEQRELYADVREAELEKLEEEIKMVHEEWPEKERAVRAEVAKKFHDIQEKIYADCHVRIEQEKQILSKEHNRQINRWSKRTKELEENVEKLQQKNSDLLAQIEELQTMVNGKGKNVYSINRSQLDHESLNTTSLEDVSHDPKIDDLSSIQCLSTKDEKYDDFIKDFSKIDMTSDESVSQKLPEISVDFENKMLTSPFNDDNSGIISESCKQPVISENTNKSISMLEQNKDVDNSVPMKKSEVMEFNTEFEIINNHIPNKSQTLLFDITENIECVITNDTKPLNKSLNNEQEDCKPTDVIRIETNVNDSLEQQKDELNYVTESCHKIHEEMVDQKEKVLNNSITENGNNEQNSPEKILQIDVLKQTKDESNNSVTESCKEINGQNSPEEILEIEANKIINRKSDNCSEVENKSSVIPKNQVMHVEDCTEESKLNKSANNNCDLENSMKNNSRSHSYESDDTQRTFRETRSRKGKIEEAQSANQSLEIDSKSKVNNKTNSDVNSQENINQHGPRTRKQLSLRLKKGKSDDVLSDDNKTPPSQIQKIATEDTNQESNGNDSREENVGVNGCEDVNSNVLKDKDLNRGLPLPDSYCTVKKDKKASDLAKENCQSLCLSSRRKLFSRRHMDEVAAEPQPPPQSARCLFFGIGDEVNSPDPDKPPKVPVPYAYQRPTRTTRQKKKLI